MNLKEFAKEGERDIIVPKKVIVATNVARYWGLKTRDRQVGKIIDQMGIAFEDSNSRRKCKNR